MKAELWIWTRTVPQNICVVRERKRGRERESVYGCVIFLDYNQIFYFETDQFFVVQ